jgi:hypothetical protein
VPWFKACLQFMTQDYRPDRLFDYYHDSCFDRLSNLIARAALACLRPAALFENVLILYSAPIALVLVEDDFVLTGAGSGGGGKPIMERSKTSLMLRAATVSSLSSPL